MKLPNQQNSSRKLVSYLGILSASVLVSLPALALITPNSTNFNNSSRLDTTIRNGQFLAQNSTGITAPNRSSTGGTQQNPTGTNNFPANGTGTIQQTPTGTNNFPANGTGTTQQTPTGTNNFPANGTGTIQQTPTGTNNSPGNPAGTTQQTPTGTNNSPGNPAGTTQQTPTGTNTSGQPSTGATRGTIRLNPRQDAFTQYMNVGYAATDQRDYQTALINFRRALNERPGNPYAVRAIQNVESYIQRQQSR